MAGQSGFFDGEERLKALSAAGDPLERLAQDRFRRVSRRSGRSTVAFGPG
jgi:hypothetical protein